MYPLEKMVWKFVDNPFCEAGRVDDDCTALCRMVNEVIVVLIVEVYHEAHVGAVLFGTKTATDSLAQGNFRFSTARPNNHPDSENVDGPVNNPKSRGIYTQRV